MFLLAFNTLLDGVYFEMSSGLKSDTISELATSSVFWRQILFCSQNTMCPQVHSLNPFLGLQDFPKSSLAVKIIVAFISAVRRV
jgi:hypothetical protein